MGLFDDDGFTTIIFYLHQALVGFLGGMATLRVVKVFRTPNQLQFYQKGSIRAMGWIGVTMLLLRHQIKGELHLMQFSTTVYGCYFILVLFWVRRKKVPKQGHCRQCKNPTTKGCSRCKKIFFCSTSCQKVGWEAHKVDCVIKPLPTVPRQEELKTKKGTTCTPPLLSEETTKVQVEVQAYIYAAAEAGIQGYTSQEILMLEQLLSFDDKQAGACYNLAVAYRNNGNATGAVSQMARAASLLPDPRLGCWLALKNRNQNGNKNESDHEKNCSLAVTSGTIMVQSLLRESCNSSNDAKHSSSCFETECCAALTELGALADRIGAKSPTKSASHTHHAPASILRRRVDRSEDATAALRAADNAGMLSSE